MAGDKPNASAKSAPLVKEVAKEIVKEAKNSQSRGRRWRRSRQQGQPQQPQAQKAKASPQHVTKQITRKLKKEGLEGPRSRFSVRVSATIGKIGPNTTQGPELQISTFLHPSLMKEPNDGTNFGPLQAAAAQWGLWRLSSLTVKCTPLVGPSAVTGSVYRISLNLTQSPGNTSWGGLGARKHLDVPVGRTTTWNLHRGDLAGPRQTWWLTDTNEEGGQSCGPMLEIHGLGKTTSTYKDEAWVGDLFIVEVMGRWDFTNYNSKPALGTLERVTDDVQASIEVGADNLMVMSIPTSSALSRHMSTAYERSTNASGVGETIWQIVDEGAGLISNVSPPPFGWLIKGGWWFVKKLLGRGANAEEQYLVYASLADAQNNKPVEAQTFSKVTHRTTLASTQINAPNTGPGTQSISVSVSGVLPEPLPAGPVTFYVAAQFSAMFNVIQDTLQTPAANNVFPVLGAQNPTDFAFSILNSPSTSAGKAMGGFLLQSDPLALGLSLDTQSSALTSIYHLDDVSGNGWTVNFNLANPAVTDCADVLAYRHESWGDNLSTSVWLVRFKKASASATLRAYCLVPSAVTSAVEQAPITFAATKLALPKLALSGTYQQQQVAFPGFRSGDYAILYSVGRYTFNDSTGVATVPTFTGAVNDFLLSTTFRSANGLLPAMLSTALPHQFFSCVALYRAPVSFNTVDQLMLEVQRRFGLMPVEVEADSSEEEDPEPTPRSKFAKQRMYEALRDSDWDHVDADVLSGLLRKTLPRGHAE